MTSAASSTAPTRSAQFSAQSPAVAVLCGVLVLAYGLVLVGATALQWATLQPPGTILGPPSFVQTLALRITEGVYLAIFGLVLAGGGVLLSRMKTRRGAEDRSHPPGRWRSLFPYAAVMLILSAAVVGALPPPRRTLMFIPSDFQLRALPGNQPYENYFTSRPFVASQGEALFPGFSVTWTDNQTGAVVERDGLVTTWLTVPSAFPSPQESATGNLAPTDGSYVAWVRYSLCETPATPPCANYTASVTGNLTIATQQAYVPVQLAFGASGSVLIVIAWAQSGIGNRRMTSR